LETASIKSAAARVSLSPSATSHALGRLRELLDDPILVRAGRTMVRSPRAEAMRPRLRRLLEEMEAILVETEEVAPASMRRSFRIAATDYAETIVLRLLSSRLASEAPMVNIYQHAHPTDLSEALRSNEHDLAVGVVADMPDDIHREHLFDERFVCLLRKGHPALKRKLCPETYASLPHVLIAPGGKARGVVDVVLERQGLRRRVARTVSSFESAPHLVAKTDFVLTVPERVAKRVASKLELARRTPPVELPGFALSLVWHRRYQDDEGHRWIRAQIQSVCATL
jgi:DNA-binding transcriptional LysR family regulator